MARKTAIASEKRVSAQLSVGAMIVATAITGWLWSKGLDNPRNYVASMAINNHSRYGYRIDDCHACHRPVEGAVAFKTALGCYTSYCHGEFLPTTDDELAMRFAMKQYTQFPDAEERARHYLGLHEAAKGMECWECHKEHSPYTPIFPDGWTTYENRDRGVSYRSIFAPPVEEAL